MSYEQVLIYTTIYLYAFWLLYLIAMGLYRAHLKKNLGWFNTILGLPFIVTAYLVDVIANMTIAVIVFQDLPKELLVTDRLKRYRATETEGWRLAIAVWLCDHVLDPLDPTGDHC